jgi:xanthine dehydrogenase accessory factor
MKKTLKISNFKVLIKGGGEMASGVAYRLHKAGFKILLTEIERPVAVRRKVSFSEAVYDGKTMVEGVEAILVKTLDDITIAWDKKKIPIVVDPQCDSRLTINPDVLVDAILAKKNTGTHLDDAPLVIALGPGFEAGKDAQFVVETNRGHNLGRLLNSGSAEPNTGVPGSIQGITSDRVLRAPAEGPWQNNMGIGDHVRRDDTVGSVNGETVKAQIDGVIRGLIRPGIIVTKNLKIGDIDPRGEKAYCFTISEKARAIGGSALEGILRSYGN